MKYCRPGHCTRPSKTGVTATDMPDTPHSPRPRLATRGRPRRALSGGRPAEGADEAHGRPPLLLRLGHAPLAQRCAAPAVPVGLAPACGAGADEVSWAGQRGRVGLCDRRWCGRAAREGLHRWCFAETAAWEGIRGLTCDGSGPGGPGVLTLAGPCQVLLRTRRRRPGGRPDRRTGRRHAGTPSGGCSSTRGLYSTSWMRPSKVRCSIISRATSG